MLASPRGSQASVLDRYLFGVIDDHHIQLDRALNQLPPEFLFERDRDGATHARAQTFNFLGFTHICGTNYQTGQFMVLRKTISKRMAAKLKDIRAQLRTRMHGRVPETGKWLQQVVRGYSNITPFRAILRGCERFAVTCCGAGYRRYGAAASNIA